MTDKQYGAPTLPPAAQPDKRGRRGQRLLWIAGPLLVVLVAGYFYVHAGRYVSTENSYVDAEQVTIAPQVAGQVVQVAVHENQAVQKGDVLFRLDPATFQLGVEQLEAQMVSVGNYLASTKDKYHSAQASLKAAQASVRYDQAQVARMQDLRKSGLVAQRKLDEAANDLAESIGERDAAASAVANAQTLLGGDVDAPVQSLSAYKALGAQLAAAKLKLERSVVRAPMDGIIGKSNLQPGDYLQVGEAAMPLVSKHMWINANFKETELTHIKVGDPAVVVADTYPDHEWKARVASISPATGGTFSLLPAQNATGNWVKVVQRIPVRLELAQAHQGSDTLRVGMSVDVSIDTGADNSLWGSWFGNDEYTRPTAAKR